MRLFKRVTAVFLLLVLAVSLLSGCGKNEVPQDETAEDNKNDEGTEMSVNEFIIELSDDGITAKGEAVGTDESADVYVSNDIIYYEDTDAYPSGSVYGEGEEKDRHTKEEAEEHTVLNITKPGNYRISGTLSKGQIRVDLGEEAKADPNASVYLILDGANINCDVAPAILFLNVYECDGDRTAENAVSEVDTTDAGANIILADGSENNISGSYVAKIYEDGGEEKKLWKQDGAIYSYMSLSVYSGYVGDGTLNLTAENEGLDSEMHLTVNGGNINIVSDNDGINTNADGMSVTTINGGNLHITAGLGEEGDGIDSNGWLVINGGNVVSWANPAADAGLDSDMGSYINGGNVAAFGSNMDWAESESGQVTMNLQFSEGKSPDGAIVVLSDSKGFVFGYDPREDELLGENMRSYTGAIISSPLFSVGDTYSLYMGGKLSGDEVMGIYDAQNILEHADGIQQCYTGTDVLEIPGGMGGNMMPPEGEKPEVEMPDGEPPVNMSPGQMARNPEMMGRPMPTMPADGEAPIMPENGDPMGGGEKKTEFYMQDMVNFFSGITDFV